MLKEKKLIIEEKRNKKNLNFDHINFFCYLQNLKFYKKYVTEVCKHFQPISIFLLYNYAHVRKMIKKEVQP